ncbi:helix-turn-helix domain-containing protein [Thermus sp. NEB1569]|uniref:helix-turn-helix domain-containing protein n=1 Tax=Thermus sp. NEB1569 TaxID=2918899 RepID=UPI00351E496D
MALKLFVDASYRDGRAAVAVVSQDGQVLHQGEICAADNNEAERYAFWVACRIAPHRATILTDSGQIQALLNGRVSPPQEIAPWLASCRKLIEEKALNWVFIGGRRRRKDKAVRRPYLEAHRRATEILSAKSTQVIALLLNSSAQEYSVAMPGRRQTEAPLPPRILAIIERRKELGLTQEELARRAGFSVSLMAKIERGAVDPRSLSALNLISLARVLGLPLSVLLDEDLGALDEHKPLAVRITSSLEEALSESKGSYVAYLSPGDIPKGALAEKLVFIEVPGRWLFSLSLPFPVNRPARLLVEMRPLLSQRGTYVGRYEGFPALFTQEDVERGSFPLYPLSRDMPTLWVEGDKPEILGLVRGIWMRV